VDLEEQPVFVTAPGGEIQSPSSRRTPEVSKCGMEPEKEEPQSEKEDVMTRLKYKHFKRDRNQDANEWLGEFEPTAIAN